MDDPGDARSRWRRRNFYRAARDGLEAELLWPAPQAPSPRPMPARRSSSASSRSPAAASTAAGVDDDEAGALLDVMAERVAAEVTGARWQRAALAALEERMMRGTALAATLDAYIEAQFSGLPVHRWPIPSRPGSRAAAGSGPSGRGPSRRLGGHVELGRVGRDPHPAGLEHPAPLVLGQRRRQPGRVLARRRRRRASSGSGARAPGASRSPGRGSSASHLLL